MAIDYNAINSEINNSSNKYKNYAPYGVHKVKLESVEVRDKDTWKSPCLTFNWAESDEYKYPRSVSHWLSLKNPAWRAKHNIQILMTLGVDQKKATELVKTAEGDESRETMKKGYEKLYSQIASRHPEVEILVQGQWRDGKPVCSDSGTQYGESDFNSGLVRMMEVHADKVEPADPLEGADEVIDLGEIPF